jgi:hypothetical protein
MFRILSQENAIVVDPSGRARSLSEKPTETTEKEGEPNAETAMRRITTGVREASICVAWRRPEISEFGQPRLAHGNHHGEERDANEECEEGSSKGHHRVPNVNQESVLHMNCLARYAHRVHDVKLDGSIPTRPGWRLIGMRCSE